MQKYYLLLSFVLVSLLSLHAEEINLKSIFETIRKNHYQEKIYLHTDKPLYIAGDSIWFKAYLLDARTHRLGISNFVYVELADKSGRVSQRVKIIKDSIAFSGFLPIPKELPSGDYQLRSYTLWMQNAGEDFFFKQNIPVENISGENMFVKPEYEILNNNKVKVTMSVTDKLGNAINGKGFDVLFSERERLIRTNKEGLADFTIDIKDNNAPLFFDLQAHGDPELYTQRFYPPALSSDYHVSFFPESGTLLPGEMQFIAFKAIGTNGLSKEISGMIYNEKGEIISAIQTMHKGMGKFFISPEEDTKYYVETEDESGLKKRFDLPVAEPGISLQITKKDNTTYYKVFNQSSIPTDSLFLIVHLRGSPLIVSRLSDDTATGSFDLEDIPAGIISFSVVSAAQRIFCERLLFINGKDTDIQMGKDRPSYGRRKPVELDFILKDSNGNPAKGNFSLSITDTEVVPYDSLSSNIVNHLLLTSDLRGYIEEPNFYFLPGEKAKREMALDLLMMTQGWTRFDMKDILAARQPKYPHKLEIGQIISGSVQNIWGKPYEGSQIILFALKSRGIDTSVSDKNGRFVFNPLFPDSTTFSLQATNKKGEAKSTYITVDKDTFPSAHPFIPERKQDLAKQIGEYSGLTQTRYMESGKYWMIDLAEVEITGYRSRGDVWKKMIANSAHRTITAKDIEEKYPGMSFWEILSLIPSLQVDIAERSVTTRGQSANFVLDDIMVDKETMDSFSSIDIETINILVDPTGTLMYSTSGNPIIRVTLKRGERSAPPKSSPGLAIISPLGFQKPTAFYVPVYEPEQKAPSGFPDFRTTLHWEPVLIPDESGRIRVKFYTSDKTSDYQIILEGISDNGELFRYSGGMR